MVGHKVILRRVISTLIKFPDPATTLTASLAEPATQNAPEKSPFKRSDELARIEAEVKDSNTAPSATPHCVQPAPQTQVDRQAASTSRGSTGPESKPVIPSDLIYGSDGKQLKPLQLTFAQFMLVNFNDP